MYTHFVFDVGKYVMNPLDVDEGCRKHDSINIFLFV